MKVQLPDSLKDLMKTVKLDSLYYFLRENIYFDKVAITVEKDLETLTPVHELLEQAGAQLVSVTPETLGPTSRPQQLLVYGEAERHKKAMSYLKHGYRGVALVTDGEVAGDIWYTCQGQEPGTNIHPDLKWLRMPCGPNEAYAFDMYLPPAKRGKNFANLLQNGALHEIKNNGFARALGYYWAENIPALWVHRTLKWKERKQVKVTRLFCWRYSH